MPADELAALRSRLPELTIADEHRLRRKLNRLARITEPARLAADTASLAAEIEKATTLLQARQASLPTISYPAELPVSARRDDLLATIGEHQVTIVAGETGSGKTTQLPKMCLELGRGVRGTIAHTQPRRLAARTVARRIADELRVDLGGPVGFAVRFTDRTAPTTLVQLMTDGLLLAQIDRDPLLRRYDTVIVDEAHERSLNIDFLLGYLHGILPERPDLKLIITSATIDPERFAEHFGGTPIVEVSGRTYPVETRYRPTELDPADGQDTPVERDQVTAIGDAVAELLRDTRGDILVFLSGEREIRDTADALRGRFGERLEVLPLYARLSTAEQQRVFAAHTGRRVVLATNVAETSLTVPGITAVVDPGTARISRYSARRKIQRLPIEAISQASANQRSGRCGRTSDGIAIRLFSESDFEERPAFTDPEILRTSLAGVILQAAAAGLGPIEDFPFLDPPDPRQVRDGVALLRELGALDEQGGLTTVGRTLARLPIDPRLGRMVIEADRLGCTDEVTIIVAGLSIPDPRERPTESRATADRHHARFGDERSDFLAYLNLWRYAEDQQRALSGSAWRRRCRAEHLHYLRLREWQDLVAGLRHAAKDVGIRRNQTPAEPTEISRALLTGMLSHIGLYDERTRDYRGVRGTRFFIHPGSGLARKRPAWVMAAELVETTRLYARTVAQVDPAWLEPAGEHLVTRTYENPRWHRRRAEAVTTEQVTLFGLPIVTGRRVSLADQDPGLAREMFLRSALVQGEWDARHDFRTRNEQTAEEIELLEGRMRRRDLLVTDDTLLAFYDARVPADVTSGALFDRWWQRASAQTPELLTLTGPDLMRPEVIAALDTSGRPSWWRQGDDEFELRYRFAPGEPDDGVTVVIGVDLLPKLRPDGFEWLVPAMRKELVTALLRGLPKHQRRELTPIPETAAALVERLPARGEPLRDVLSRELERLARVRVVPEHWPFDALAPHLQMTFLAVSEGGEAIDQDKDLHALQQRHAPRLSAQIANVAARMECSGMTAFPADGLDQTVDLPAASGRGEGYPGLVDEGATVGIRVFSTLAAQRTAMLKGTRRLLMLRLPDPAAAVQRSLSGGAQLTLATAPHGSLERAISDATACAIDALIEHGGGPAYDLEGFSRLCEHVGPQLPDAVAQVMRWLVAIVNADRALARALDEQPSRGIEDLRADVQRQRGGLVFDGVLTATGAERLPDVVHYLKGAAVRVRRMATHAATDRDRLAVIVELEALYLTRVAALPDGQPPDAALVDARWALQELRLALLASDVKATGRATAKHVRRLLVR